MSSKNINNVNWRPFDLLTNAYVALLAVFLLACSNYSFIQTTKSTLFYIICGGYVCLTLLLCIETVLIGIIPPKVLLQKIKPDSKVQILMLAYLLLSLISTVFSKYPSVWIGASRFEGFFTIAIYILSFYFVSKFAKIQRWMIYLFGIAVSLSCTVAVVQLAGSSFLYPAGVNFYDSYEKYTGSYIGTIGNVDFVAAFLGLSIPLFILYMIKAKDSRRGFLIIPAILSLAVLLKIKVLLGYVAILAAVAVAIPLIFNSKRRGCLVYFSVLVTLVLAVLAAVYVIPFENGFLYELHSILHGQLSDTFGSGRIRIWKEVLRRVPDNLLFGTGPDTMILAGIEPFRRVDEVYGEIVAHIDSAHNDYLNILFHQGLLAFTAYAGAVIAFAISFFKKAPHNVYACIFGVSIIAYLSAVFFGLSVLFVAPYFWLLLGFYESSADGNQKKILNPQKSVRHSP